MKLLSVFSSDFLTKIKDRIGLTPSPSNTDGQALVVSGGDYTYGYPTQLSTASGSAPSFAARAWVNFDGTAVTATADMTGVRASGNVSSVVDNGTGDYTINFTIAMPDVNYCTQGTGSTSSPSAGNSILITTSDSPAHYTVNSVRVFVKFQSPTSAIDTLYAHIVVFR